jgi:excisionase family DNA binding protein
MTHEATLHGAETVIALTPQQAADRLGCSKVHIYRLVNSGLIQSVDISAPGSQRTKTRILLEDLNTYIRTAGRTTQPSMS